MAKKPVDEWQPKGIEDYLAGRRFYSDADVDAIIDVAGGLPDGTVTDWLPDPDTGEMADRVVSRREALAHRLELAAHWWVLEETWKMKPPPASVIKALERIAKAAKRLNVALGISQGDDPDKIPQKILIPLRAQANAMGERLGGFPHHPPMRWPMTGQPDHFIDYAGMAQLRDDVAGVGRILEWATAAIAREAPRKAKRASEPKHKPDMATKELLGSLAGIWIDLFEKAPGVSFIGGESSNKGKPAGNFFHFTKAAIKPLPINLTDGAIGERLHGMFGKLPGAVNAQRPRDKRLSTKLLIEGSGGKSRRKKSNLPPLDAKNTGD